MLDKNERNKILYEWNNTSHAYPVDKCIHQLFEKQAKEQPEAIALIDGEHKLSYSALSRYSNQLANYLVGSGVESGALVGICLERTVAMYISILAILKVGGAYVPMDPTYPAERLRFIIQDTEMATVLTHSSFLHNLPNIKTNYIYINEIEVQLEAQIKTFVELYVQPQDLAYVIYTSGTTGQPKGVKVSHANVQNYSFWFCEKFGITTEDVFDFSSPLTFDLSVTCTLVPLMYGAKVVLCNEVTKAEPFRYVENLSQNFVTLIKITPSYFKEILLILKGKEQLQSLRTIILGGEAIVPQDVENWLNIYPNHKIVNEYGPTEATVATIAYTILKEHDYAKSKFIPIGRPAFNTQIYILTEELEPCAVGVIGELYIGGESTSQGYLNRPELTAEKFVVDPFINEPGRFIYKTGDLAKYLEDGNIQYLGRVDHQIKIRGFRIEAGDIESNLLQHTNILSAAVIVYEDGERKKLIAYVVCKQGQAPGVFELRSFLSDKLPGYMIPHAFIFLNSLPMTPNGKLDRDALPKPGEPVSDVEYAAPENDIESALVLIWQSLLKVKTIGVNDDFFIMGGDSLLSAQLIMQVEEKMGVEISLVTFYENPTIFKISPIINEKIKTNKLQAEIELAELLDQIENMDDEDIKSQLLNDE